MVGADELEVVGESFHQDALWSIVGPTAEPVRQEIVAVLIPETDNEHDDNAIAVRIDGNIVGYLSREDAETHRLGLLELQRRIERLIALNGIVVGAVAWMGLSRACHQHAYELAPQKPEVEHQVF